MRSIFLYTSFFSVFWLLCAVSQGRCQEVPDDSNDAIEAELAELEALLAELDEMILFLDGDPEAASGTGLQPLSSSFFDWTGQIGLSAGVDSNVLLAPTAFVPIKSAFVRTSADFQVNHSLSRFGSVGLIALFERRVFEEAGLKPEEFAIGELAWNYQLNDWTITAGLLYMFSNSVYDAVSNHGHFSEIITERDRDGSIELKRSWGRGGSLAVRTVAGSARFDGSSDDYDRIEFQIEGGLDPFDWLSLRSWGSVTYRRYSDASVLSPIGTPGDVLRRERIWQAGIWMRFRLFSDGSLSIRSWAEFIRDNAGDYYDCDRYTIRPRFTWTPGPWTVYVEGSLLKVDYLSRRLWEKPGDFRTQWQSKWSAKVDVRRSFGDHLEIFASGQKAQLDANSPGVFASKVDYSVWLGELGIQYGF